MSKIQIVTRDKSGCDYLRCVLPAIYLQKDADWSASNSIEVLWIGQDEWRIDCDILIYNKFIATPLNILKEYQAKGMKIIVDMDDMEELPSWHINAEGWNGSGSGKLTVEHMKMADIVTCTSMRLQQHIRQYNKNTVVIPNALPFGDGVYGKSGHIPVYKTRFMYAGGVYHLPDVKLLEGKFRKIASEPFIKDNAEFILAGYEKSRKTRRVYQTREDMKAANDKYTLQTSDIHGPYDDMKTVFSHTGSYRVLPTLPVQKYMEHYDQADVVLVPLVANEWNSYKSVLKVLEAATRDLPVICSSVAPYSDLRPCEGILYVEYQDDWLKYIRKLIKEPAFREDTGKALSEWVQKEYDLRLWNKTRIDIFSSL